VLNGLYLYYVVLKMSISILVQWRQPPTETS